MISLFRGALQALRDLPEWLEQLCLVIQDAAGPLAGSHALRERVEALEASQAKMLAEAEGWYQRAESAHKAARAAEERARGMKNRAEALQAEDGGEEGEDPFLAAARQLQESNGGGGPEGGVHPVPSGMEGAPVSPKDIARMAKFGA